MHLRVMVRDPRNAHLQDVGIECAPEHTVGEVLGLVANATGVGGAPLVDGEPLDPDARMSDSPLRNGALLDYTGTGHPARSARSGPVLHVVSGRDAGRTLALARGRIATVGRGAVDLDLGDTDVSRAHLRVRWDGHEVEVFDAGSANRTWMSAGGTFHGVAPVPFGTWVGVPLDEQVQVGGTRLVVEAPGGSDAVLRSDGLGGLLINRAPRHRAPAPSGSVTLPPVPTESEPQRLTTVIPMVLLPLVLGVVFAFVVGNPLFLLLALGSPIAGLLVWWLTKRAERQRGERAQADYRAKVGEAMKTALAHLDEEDAHLRREWPDPNTVLHSGTERTLGLWQRGRGDDDWLRVRLGTAEAPSDLQVRGTVPASGWRALVLPAAPVGVDLAAAGAIGVVGADADTGPVLDWVITQLAVLHASGELSVSVIAPGCGSLAWTRWLPHLRGAGGAVSAAWRPDDVDWLVRQLNAIVTARQVDRAARSGGLVPDVVVVLVGTAELCRRSGIAALLRSGVAAGIRFVCVDQAKAGLPSECTAVLDLTSGARLSAAGRPEQEIQPDRVDPGQAMALGRSLAPLSVVGAGPTAGFPDAVRLHDLHPNGTAEEIAATWRLCPENTRVPIGRDASGTVTIDISDAATADGPHGVVVGESGSGKSEFLLSLLVGLAVGSSPEHLNFILVDYRGGATMKDIAALPHVVASISNLSESPGRLLAALDAEIERRERLFSRAGVGNLVEYRRRAEIDPGLPTLARLIVVVDEFAVLNSLMPTAVDKLVTIPVKGRAAGMHLILGTQRAADVTPAIADNTRLRVCLRVGSASESDRILKGHNDAFTMPRGVAGRAFFIGGGDLRQVQPAWPNAPVGGAAVLPARAVPLNWDDTALPAQTRAAEDGLRTDLQDLVEQVRRAADLGGLVPGHSPLPAPLPGFVQLDALAPVAFAAPIGIRDEPGKQRKRQFAFPVSTGSLLVVGAAQTGKTTALRTIAAGATRDHGPHEVNLYAIETGRALAPLTGFPHCGAVVSTDDGWRVDRLISRLESSVRERRELLADKGFDTIAEMWAADPATAPPHVVLLVDGVEGVADHEQRWARLTALMEQGQRVGFTLCMTARETVLRQSITKHFEHAVVFRMPDDDKRELLKLPKGTQLTGLAPGRARWAPDGDEIQVGVVSADPSGTEQRDALHRAARTSAARWRDHAARPFRVDPLPRSVAMADVAATGGHGGAVLLGVAGDVLGPRWLDPAEAGGVLTVAGPRRSGRSNAVCAMAVSLVRAGRRVALLRTRAAAAHEHAVAAGVDLWRPEDLGEVLASDIDAVVVDDVESARISDQHMAALAAAGGPVFVAVIDIERLSRYATAPVVKALSWSGAGVLLSPPQGEYLGIQLSRAEAFDGPPGRGFFVCDGERELGQVPLLD